MYLNLFFPTLLHYTCIHFQCSLVQLPVRENHLEVLHCDVIDYTGLFWENSRAEHNFHCDNPDRDANLLHRDENFNYNFPLSFFEFT